jgi:hypothetical protein
MRGRAGDYSKNNADPYGMTTRKATAKKHGY